MTNQTVSKQNIRVAHDAALKVAAKRREEADESYRSYGNFFNRLALLAGGTIALSVTFLGYLKTLAVQPIYLGLLTTSWLLLFLCLVSGTFYSFFHTTYLGHARTRELARRLKEEHETVAAELPNLWDDQIVDTTGAGLERYIESLGQMAASRDADTRRSGHWERTFGLLYRASSITACLSFVAGLSLLLLFAVANLTTPAR